MKQHSPRQITNDGVLYQIKRPLYKQPLFWTTIVSLGLVFVLSIVVVGLSVLYLSQTEEGMKLNGRTDAMYRSYDYKNEHSNQYFGEAAFFRNGAKIIVQSARVDTDRKMSDDATGVAVVVSVRIKNTSNRSLLVSPYDFDLYDEKEGLYILDDSTFDNNQIGTNLAPGKEVQFDLVFDGERGDKLSYIVAYEQTKWSNGKLKNNAHR